MAYTPSFMAQFGSIAGKSFGDFINFIDTNSPPLSSLLNQFLNADGGVKRSMANHRNIPAHRVTSVEPGGRIERCERTAIYESSEY